MLYSSFNIAQVAINEISTTGEIEIINTSGNTVDISSFWLCDRPGYEQISRLDIVCGSTTLEAGETVTVATSAISISGSGDELAIYTTTAFGNSDAIVDYVIWGDRMGSTREPVAVSAGIWTADDRAPDFANTSTLNWDGQGENAAAWSAAAPSICPMDDSGDMTDDDDDSTGDDDMSDDDMTCDAAGGTLTGGPFTFTEVGDGTPDMIQAGSITVDGQAGENFQWVVTDDEGYILGLPPMPSAVDFDTPGAGTCLIWHLAYTGEITGLGMGLNASNIEGCFSLSNSVSVIRSNATFDAVGDGTPDHIPAGSITSANTNGENLAWVVTDSEGYILGLPPMPSAVNFDNPGAGTCLIWRLASIGELTGVGMGLNASDIQGCFSLSNPITVVRNNASGCDANGGELFGGPFTFDAVGDGTPESSSYS